MCQSVTERAVPTRLIEECGPLQGLINNASHFVFDAPGSVDAVSLNAHLGPNLVAPVLLARAFAAQKPAQGLAGRLLNKLRPHH